MIHRIDRVNPDVDDRVIKPNEARMAKNLRFGASTDDTNLSGGTLILGNKKLTAFVPPAGTNKVMGVYADLESRNVFFAAYNSNGNHGIYRINGTTDVVQAVVYGSWLNFQGADEYNVSITGVDGKLYWTDNVNEPRMVNVEKGIRTQAGETIDVYPPVVEPWHYTQIKRPPGQALEVPYLGLNDTSITLDNRTLTNTGLQYSYYYVYDNYEESRLAPYTFNGYAVYNVNVRIPDDEFTTYTSNTSLIKKVVIVVRNGNDGVWRELDYYNNEIEPKQTWFFTNVLTAIKNTVASDITDARFDSVPLVSGTNEIAQNRINHANYRTDYETGGSISIDATIKSVSSIISTDSSFPVNDPRYYFNSFMPWGRYAIGVELVDEYGRTLPVTNTKDIIAPVLNQQFSTAAGTLYPSGARINLFNGNNLPSLVTNGFEQGSGYNTVAEYKITGALPDWVKRVNVVRSRAKNIITMHQSLGQMFMWYETESQETRFVNFVMPQLTAYDIPVDSRTTNVNVIYNAGEINNKFTFKGFAIKFYDNAPFTQTDNLYVTIYQSYNPTQANTLNYLDIGGYGRNPNDAGYFGEVLKFKVAKIENNLIYIKTGDEIQRHPSYATANALGTIYLTPYSYPVAVYDSTVVSAASAASDARKWYNLLWNFTITQEGNLDDQIVYTTENTYTREEYDRLIGQFGYVKGWLTGDASLSKVRKTYPTTANDANLYVFPDIEGGQPAIYYKTLRRDSFDWFGTMISMSPRDIYAQEWNQNLGQLNTVNYKDARNRILPSNICFSGILIQGTQVNGLNKFISLDFRQAPAENGPITALVTTNATQREPGVLLAIGTFGVSSFYYDAIQLTNVDGSNNVTTTDAYLASQRPLVGQYGTARPMSVTKTPLGTVYWWSDVVNDMIRYSNAGLERLGNTFSFANYLRKNYNDTPLLITWYDQVTDEINLIGTGKPASVFSERFKTFQGERDYTAPFPTGGLTPDRGIGVATKQYLFVNGEVYVTDVDDSSVPNNFIFGEFKNPDLTIVTNESPVNVKRWNQIKMFGSRPTRVILSSSGFDIVNSDTLLSYIEPGWWIKRKGDWEAAIRRASNTEGGVYAGKLMESRIIYSNFAFSAEGFEKLNFIEVKSNVSIVQ